MDFLHYQQCKRKHYYGYGSAVYKEEDFEAEGQLCSETQTDRTCTYVRRVVISGCIREPVEVALVLEF
jgi:hypothetical protein